LRITFRDTLSANVSPEDSTFALSVKFWDDGGEPWLAAAPTTVDYRVDCLTTGVTMTDWTSVSPAAVVTINVPVAANAINSEVNWREKRQLTVKANKDLSTQYLSNFTYYVENNSAI
jgi:hypothetical protein